MRHDCFKFAQAAQDDKVILSSNMSRRVTAPRAALDIAEKRMAPLGAIYLRVVQPKVRLGLCWQVAFKGLLKAGFNLKVVCHSLQQRLQRNYGLFRLYA